MQFACKSIIFQTFYIGPANPVASTVHVHGEKIKPCVENDVLF